MKPGRFGHQSHCSGQHRPHLVLPEDREATQGQIQNITLLFSVTSHTWRGVSIKNKLPNRYQIWQTQFSIVGFFNTSGKTISILLLIFYSRNTLVHSTINFSVTGPSSSPLDLSFEHEAQGFPGGSDCKESACNAGDLGSTPGSARYPAEGHGNPLQYSCLENSMDREPGRLQFMGQQRVRHD